MKSIIFIAPPAAGKGTLSDFLEKNLGYTHISTGDLFRERIKVQDEFAKELEHIISTGNLIDDECTFSLLNEKLKIIDQKKPFILEGIPRTLQQARVLDIILRDLGFSDYVVVNVHVDEEILKKRMTGRRICKSCHSTYNVYFEKFKPHKEETCDKCGNKLSQRVDDHEESFKVRYEIFNKNNQPILDYYKEQNRLYQIDNSKEEHDEALKELQRIVGAFVD